ncbi:MAG: hypothetical protein BGO43_13510 [Gammaproteobacteria bacterium 39-13]|jgi:hypothetical protein|nr:lipocalin-like domain-containing protein [Gammaproteobacteria bacterium]OJV94763.1 MAG: hypothetical protein BGO43_13510 [Gammaproteobacteria bacterium 39-13]
MSEKNIITQEVLLGTWELREFKITLPDGTEKNWGIKPHGFIIYDKSGHVSTSINSGSVEDNPADNFKNILFYAGTYTIAGPNKILHTVTNASDPKRIGKTMVRNAEIINNNQLCIRASGDYGQAYLLLQRI